MQPELVSCVYIQGLNHYIFDLIELNKAQLAKMSPMVSQMFLTWVEKYRYIGTGDVSVKHTGTRACVGTSTGTGKNAVGT